MSYYSVLEQLKDIHNEISQWVAADPDSPAATHLELSAKLVLQVTNHLHLAATPPRPEPQIGDFVRTWMGYDFNPTLFVITGPSPDKLYDLKMTEVGDNDDPFFTRLEELYPEGPGMWTYVCKD
jgi:hypothetical protein